MDCNKDEAVRAKKIAEKKMENNDFEGARKIAKKAQSIYPELENISQLLTICDVHCSSLKRVLGSEMDWYEILQVQSLADELTIKKQYRRLALFLHPDKNRFPGAEAAFKLICEANAVLSDPAKKSLYDNKIKVPARSAPMYKPIHKKNMNPQYANMQRTQTHVSNGLNGLNFQQPAGSSSAFRQDVFWTSCPFCSMSYQYKREFVNISIRCQTCSKIFMACEVSSQSASTGVRWGQYGTQPMPSKPSSYRPAFEEKGAPDQGNLKKPVQNSVGVSAPQTESHASQNPVQQEQGIHTETGSGYSRSSWTSKVNASEKGKNKDTKRNRKQVVDSSESFDTSTDSDVDDVFNGVNEKEMDPGSNNVHFRRSTRKRQQVIYNESDDDFASPPIGSGKRESPEDGGQKQKDDLDGEGSMHQNQNHFSAADYYNSKGKHIETDLDKEVKVRRETGSMRVSNSASIEIKSDSDCDDGSETGNLDCAEPEFSNFDNNRDEGCFATDQIWACYDDFDGMPRFYAKVRKVQKSPFELRFTWLEVDPTDEAGKKCVAENLPIACGSFKLGKTENTSRRLTFSHKMCGEKGEKRGSHIIYPRKGETWAIFKDWDISSSSFDPDSSLIKYEIVEVVSDFTTGAGIEVIYLDKITGFVSLFQRTCNNETESFLIGPHELYKFSHCVPCFKMTGSERAGVPSGSFELDPASLPLNPDFLHYPGKAKTDPGKLDSGDDCRQSQP